MPPLIRNYDQLPMESSPMPHAFIASSDLKIAECDHSSHLMKNKYTENADLFDYILKSEQFSLFEQRQWNMDLSNAYRHGGVASCS